MENITVIKSVFSNEELEIQEMFAKADEINTEKLFVDSEGDIMTIDEIKQIIIPSDTDNPAKKYEIYYKGIQKLLKNRLPSGTRYKEVNKQIREEINTYLAGGKRKKGNYRGADARMGNLTYMDITLAEIIQWTAVNGSFTDLYSIFNKLNKEVAENQ